MKIPGLKKREPDKISLKQHPRQLGSVFTQVSQFKIKLY